MPSDIETQLQKIDQLFVHGKLQEALSLTEECLKRKDLSKEDELNFLIQKSIILSLLGDTKEALQIGEKVLKESKKIKNITLQVDALLRIVLNSHFEGRFNEGLKLVDKGLKLVSKIKNLPAKEISKRKARLLIWKAGTILFLGDFERALELANVALSLAEESDYKIVISYVLNRIGTIYLNQNDIKTSEKYYKKALAVAEEIENKIHIGLNYFGLANIMSLRREYQQALDLYENAFALSKEVGSTIILFEGYNDLGEIYTAMFQFDKALECFQESLKYVPRSNYSTYSNIGYIYFLRYDLKAAQANYMTSLKFCEEQNDRRILPVVLFNLIEISLELNNIDQAKIYFERLKQISDETGFAQVNKYYRYALISIFKASGNIGDLAEAVKLLNEYLADEDLSADTRLSFLYSLLEIRIKELQLSPTEEAFIEVQKRSHHLEVEAKDRHYRWFLADVHRLQSQLSLVELNITKAHEFLDKAQAIADEIDVELLKKKIKDDRERINQQLSSLKKFQEKEAPISETMKLVTLEKTMKSIKQDTVIEDRDKETGKIIEYRKLFALKI